MKILISYCGYDRDGSYIAPLLPVHAQSPENAERDFVHAAAQALRKSQGKSHEKFSVFGCDFAMSNFFDPAPQAMLQKENRQRELRGEAPIPVYQNGRGDNFMLSLPYFFTLEEWFDQELAKRCAPQAQLEAAV